MEGGMYRPNNLEKQDKYHNKGLRHTLQPDKKHFLKIIRWHKGKKMEKRKVTGLILDRL